MHSNTFKNTPKYRHFLSPFCTEPSSILRNTCDHFQVFFCSLLFGCIPSGLFDPVADPRGTFAFNLRHDNSYTKYCVLRADLDSVILR
jgi:hypothetical protein